MLKTMEKEDDKTATEGIYSVRELSSDSRLFLFSAWTIHPLPPRPRLQSRRVSQNTKRDEPQSRDAKGLQETRAGGEKTPSALA
jgi:hypothetical protein